MSVKVNYKTHTHILNCPFYRLFKNKILNKDDIDPYFTKLSPFDIKNTSHCLIIFDSDNYQQILIILKVFE